MRNETPARLAPGERIHIMDAYYFATTHIIREGVGQRNTTTLCGITEFTEMMLRTSRTCYAATRFDVNYGFGEATPIKYLVTCIHCRAAYITEMEASLPNLTERLNKVTQSAFEELASLAKRVGHGAALRGNGAKGTIALRAYEARERIMFGEIGLRAKLNIQMSWPNWQFHTR